MYAQQDLYSFSPDKALAKFGYSAYFSTKHVFKTRLGPKMFGFEKKTDLNLHCPKTISKICIFALT